MGLADHYFFSAGGNVPILRMDQPRTAEWGRLPGFLQIHFKGKQQPSFQTDNGLFLGLYLDIPEQSDGGLLNKNSFAPFFFLVFLSLSLIIII